MELQNAFRAWVELLGQPQVFDNDMAQSRYGYCTTGIHRQLLGALRPLDRAQIPTIVKIAAQFRVPLYPISTGHNWGYGTALPPVGNCLILDLSQLNRIVDFDADSGLVTIEPGVTQGKLSEFLEQKGHPYMVPVTGAGPMCSILGNVLERGYGITPYTDHFEAMMAIEVVLPDGRIYTSAHSELGGEQIDRAFKWGVGPYLDGIFTQSGLGVVTQMTIALARRPDSTKSFIFGLKQPEKLAEVVKCVHEIITGYPGVVGGINLMNAHRVLAMTAPYPEDLVGSDELMSPEILSELCQINMVMPWTGFGTLYGSRSVVKVVQREIKNILNPLVSRLFFFSPGGVRTASRIGKMLPDIFSKKLNLKLGMLERSLELVKGLPNETALPLCYWLKGKQPRVEGAALDPAHDGCGLIWFAPLVPMNPDRVVSYVQMVTAIMCEHRLEPLITLTSLSNRCFDSTVPLLFDLDSEKSCKDAERCYWALLNMGREQGFLPYRVGIQTMNWLSEDNSTYWQLVREIKATLDPHAIISPGRYV